MLTQVAIAHHQEPDPRARLGHRARDLQEAVDPLYRDEPGDQRYELGDQRYELGVQRNPKFPAQRGAARVAIAVVEKWGQVEPERDHREPRRGSDPNACEVVAHLAGDGDQRVSPLRQPPLDLSVDRRLPSAEIASQRVAVEGMDQRRSL